MTDEILGTGLETKFVVDGLHGVLVEVNTCDIT